MLLSRNENSAMCTFFMPPVGAFTCSGPMKSTPTFENGGAFLTKNFGNAALCGET